MSGRCAYTRLRVLVEASRRLDPEAAKDLLISLHKVLSEIQLLKQQAINGSEAESEADDEKIRYCPCEEDCVRRIVGDMVCMLRTEREFVQHSAVNVLVTLSELMVESEKDFETFFLSLSRYLEMAMSNGLSWISTSSNIHSHSLFSVQSSVWEKKNMGTVNWRVVSCTIQIYRRILKNLKQNYEEKVLQVYLKYICSWLAFVPWRSAGDMHVDQSTFSGHPEIYCNKVQGPKLKMLLSGNLLQLFCSLADQGYYSDSATSLELRHQVLRKIHNLVPLLSSWCLNSQKDVSCSSSSIHHYFKHKLLMLMVRLVDEISVDRTSFHSCLEHLHKYFEEDLNQKLTLIEITDITALQDSPFSQSAYEEGVLRASQPHLQRLAILLFFKCTVSMITLEAKRNLSCVCANSLTSADLEVKCCDSRKGVAELYIWLLGQCPIDSSVGFDTYVEICKTFASSLLQLFVNEDDMLFQVLLQVFNLPSSTTQMLHENKFSLPKVKCDIILHVSNLFNPVLLFHTFLSKLQYDHQILLDYLISKDVGLSCAEYLLKCLRKVSESWRSFMQFSCKKASIQSKKRKIFPTVSKKDADETHTLWERGLVFEQAKQCLVSLRVSVENLHQRRLFPYNAEVLLKRLRRFEEQCLIEENQNRSDS